VNAADGIVRPVAVTADPTQGSVGRDAPIALNPALKNRPQFPEHS
jgi:hypothetical protein